MPKKELFFSTFLLIAIASLSPKPAFSQSSTTYYFSPTYEKTDGVATKYYPLAGGTTVVKRADQVSYLHQDHLGSTRLVTSEQGTVNSQLDYYPYGSPRLTGSTQLTGLTDRLYTSQILDSSTDLYFYNARQYNPLTGAFISADVAQGLNRYAYVSGNPISRSDPSGLQDWTTDQLAQTIWNYGGEVEGYDVMGVGDDELMWRAGRVYAGRALFWERHEEQLKNDLNLQMELTFLSQAMAGEDLGKIMIASAGQAFIKSFIGTALQVWGSTQTTNYSSSLEGKAQKEFNKIINDPKVLAKAAIAADQLEASLKAAEGSGVDPNQILATLPISNPDLSPNGRVAFVRATLEMLQTRGVISPKETMAVLAASVNGSITYALTSRGGVCLEYNSAGVNTTYGSLSEFKSSFSAQANEIFIGPIKPSFR